jgi:anhydro-N-acetylmuramic acid kinase
MDGISAAAVSFAGKSPRLISAYHRPYPDQLKEQLTTLVSGDGTTDLRSLLEIDHQTGLEFARCANQLKQILTDWRIEAIGSHGQTVYHLPDSSSPNTMQLGDPNLIAELTGITTITDWRRRDMAAGGQGAPLAPLFHNHFLRTDADIAILNLGGIANVTVIPAIDSAKAPVGFDTGPANTLMDCWIKQELGQEQDNEGIWAASGTVNAALLKLMLQDRYFQTSAPKSTGREYFNLAWLQPLLASKRGASTPADIQATLAELTAESVSRALHSLQTEYAIKYLYLCGGGIHNHHLVGRLEAHLPSIMVRSSSETGIDPDYMEAMAFAWFAQKTLKREPLDTTPFTGARHPRILGGIYQA